MKKLSFATIGAKAMLKLFHAIMLIKLLIWLSSSIWSHHDIAKMLLKVDVKLQSVNQFSTWSTTYLENVESYELKLYRNELQIVLKERYNKYIPKMKFYGEDVLSSPLCLYCLHVLSRSESINAMKDINDTWYECSRQLEGAVFEIKLSNLLARKLQN